MTAKLTTTLAPPYVQACLLLSAANSDAHVDTVHLAPDHPSDRYMLQVPPHAQDRSAEYIDCERPHRERGVQSVQPYRRIESRQAAHRREHKGKRRGAAPVVRGRHGGEQDGADPAAKGEEYGEPVRELAGDERCRDGDDDHGQECHERVAAVAGGNGGTSVGEVVRRGEEGIADEGGE
ncbi:hypothetical protein VP1G_10858 [Cytospora mali]|uniref:Uncharacterized protein n=1 Tax=Cytospora mali TaxID=578113 RepID=A0A194UZ78_CYTMA|nr:hypothetical protein VP1G_10858 [Valsa mali var. pyri (nom. inval.)]